MSFYFIVLRQTSEYLLSYDKVLATIEKITENPHIHLVLKSDISVDTLRRQIQKFYPLKKQVSVKLCKDNEKSICYILKEGNIIVNTLIDDLEPYLAKVKDIQQNIAADKSNYARFLCKKYVPLEDLDNLDYHIILEHTDIFILTQMRGDYKGFDDIIRTRFRNAIINFHYPDYAEFLIRKKNEKVENFKISVKLSKPMSEAEKLVNSFVF